MEGGSKQRVYWGKANATLTRAAKQPLPSWFKKLRAASEGLRKNQQKKTGKGAGEGSDCQAECWRWTRRGRDGNDGSDGGVGVMMAAVTEGPVKATAVTVLDGAGWQLLGCSFPSAGIRGSGPPR